MELVDVVDSKSTAGDSVPVRVRSPAPSSASVPRNTGRSQYYPGVAQLVARLLWEQDAAGSNPVTRTTFLRKTACLGGFSSFFVLLFVFKAIAVQRWFQGKKSDWSMSKDSR